MNFLRSIYVFVLNATSERFFRDIDSSVFKEGRQVIYSNLVFLFKHSKYGTPS